MKLRSIKNLSLASLLMFDVQSIYSQGSFVNLNFESAKIVLDPTSPFYPNGVYSTNAIPGWTAYTYGTVQPDILYNTVTLGSAGVSIIDTNMTAFLGFSLTPLQGNYSTYIEGSTGGTPSSAAIGQTGQIPVNAQSVTFWGQLGSLQITFNGQVIPYNPIQSGSKYTVYGGDISQFAGQTGQLLITALPNSYGFIDNIQFSSSPVPEASGLALFWVGGIILGLVRRRSLQP